MVGARGRGPGGFAIRGKGGGRRADAVEEERKPVSFFEEREDELGAWVAGAQPA